MIRGRDSIGIDWRPDGLRAVRFRRELGGIRWLGQVSLPRQETASVGEQVRAALGPVSGPVVVGLPGEQGFLRRLALPAPDRFILRQLLEVNLARHLPLPVEKLFFDFAVLRREHRQWQLLVAAAPRKTVDAVVDPLAAGGVSPTGVTLTPVAVAAVAILAGAQPGPGFVGELAGGILRAYVLDAGASLWRGERPAPDRAALGEALRILGDEARRASSLSWALWMGEGESEPLEEWARPLGIPCLDPFRRVRGAPGSPDPAYTAAMGLALQGLGRGPWRLNLLNPATPTPRRVVWMRTGAAVALLLLSLGAGLWLNEYRLERRALAKQRATIQRLAPQVQALAALARRSAELRPLVEGVERGTHEASKILLLRELTLLAPPDTWLTRLTLKRGQVELAGYAGSAQEMIVKLEASPRFQQAAFAGSIEREGAQERFMIRARLR